MSPAKSRRMLALHTHRMTWPVRISYAMLEPPLLRRGIRVGLALRVPSSRPRPHTTSVVLDACMGGRRKPRLRGHNTTYQKSIEDAVAVYIGGGALFF